MAPFAALGYGTFSVVMSANQSRFRAAEYNFISHGVCPSGKSCAARDSETRFADIQAAFPLSRGVLFPTLPDGAVLAVFGGVGGPEDGLSTYGTAPHRSTAQDFLA